MFALLLVFLLLPTGLIDLSQAYLQLPLDDELKKFVVINTHKGLFRLPFGISASPGIFQRVMDNLLQGIPGVVAYLDDILIMGPTAEEHLKSLEAVLNRLMTAGHHMLDGSERPIAYASRSLSKAERNYSQLGLSYVFGVNFISAGTPF